MNNPIRMTRTTHCIVDNLFPISTTAINQTDIPDNSPRRPLDFNRVRMDMVDEALNTLVLGMAPSVR